MDPDVTAVTCGAYSRRGARCMLPEHEGERHAGVGPGGRHESWMGNHILDHSRRWVQVLFSLWPPPLRLPGVAV